MSRSHSAVYLRAYYFDHVSGYSNQKRAFIKPSSHQQKFCKENHKYEQLRRMCIVDFCRQVPTAQRVQLQPVSQQQLQLQSAGGRAQIITAQPISFATTPRAATTVNAVAGGSAGWSAVPQKRPLDYYYEEPRYCTSAKLWY